MVCKRGAVIAVTIRNLTAARRGPVTSQSRTKCTPRYRGARLCALPPIATSMAASAASVSYWISAHAPLTCSTLRVAHMQRTMLTLAVRSHT